MWLKLCLCRPSIDFVKFNRILFEKNFNIFSSSMIKWFAYIVLLLIFAPCLSFAKINDGHFKVVSDKLRINFPVDAALADTGSAKNTKKQEDDKKKIKEVAKAKKQPKPEKVEPGDSQVTTPPKKKPKRQRRPEGMERPPEIPRRSGN